jgi:hypothetical protein
VWASSTRRGDETANAGAGSGVLNGEGWLLRRGQVADDEADQQSDQAIDPAQILTDGRTGHFGADERGTISNSSEGRIATIDQPKAR